MTGPQHKQASQYPPENTLQTHGVATTFIPIKQLMGLEILLQEHSPEQVKQEMAPDPNQPQTGNPPAPQQGLLLNHGSLDSLTTPICFPAQKHSQKLIQQLRLL